LEHNIKGIAFLKSTDVKTANKIFKMMNNVVEENSEENMIQIVTDIVEKYKIVGYLLT